MMLHKTSGRWRLGLALSLCTTFLWGILPIALKTLLDAMDPFTITWYRFLVAAAVLSVFVFLRNGLPPKKSFKGPVLFILMVACFALCGNYVIFLLGLGYLSPSTAIVLVQLSPGFMLLGGVFVFKEQFSLRQWAGFIVLLIGLLLFFNERLGDLVQSFSTDTLGVLLILAAAVTWATYALAQKQLLSVFPSTTIMWFIYLSGVVLLLPITKISILTQLTPFQLLLLGFCAFNTIAAYGCFSEALNHWEASRVSAVLSITPLITMVGMKFCAVFFPGFILPEHLNLLSVGGACLVVGGSAMCALKR